MDRWVEWANKDPFQSRKSDFLLISKCELSLEGIGPLNPTIHEGLEWPLQLNSLCVCLFVLSMLQIF